MWRGLSIGALLGQETARVHRVPQSGVQGEAWGPRHLFRNPAICRPDGALAIVFLRQEASRWIQETVRPTRANPATTDRDFCHSDSYTHQSMHLLLKQASAWQLQEPGALAQA